MKTAISIPDEIFRELEKFALDNNYSRSEVFVMAVKDFLEGLKSKQLLDALNEALKDIETTEDAAVRKKAVQHYVKGVLKDPY
jgi:predicted transcriptional regulator